MDESRPKILVVDDQPANLTVMLRLLKDVEAEVMTAGSGNKALSLCWQHEFALLLLDVQMPDMNGYEVMEILHDTRQGKDIPVVLFITAAYTDEEHRLKGYDVGAIDYIQKPVNDKILQAKVNLFLELYNKKQLEKKYAALLEERNLLLQRELDEQKRMRQLAEREERLRLVVQNMPVLMDAFDEAGNILVWNQECERTTGYSRDEIVGNPKAMEQLYPDADYRETMMQEWQKRGNNYRDWEWQLTCKSGAVKVISWSNLADLLPISGWAAWGIGVDVTERKATAEELRGLRNMLANIIDSMPSVLVGVDSESRVTQWNRQAEKMTGKRADEAQGKPLVEVFPQLKGELKNVRTAIREGRTVEESKVTGILGDERGYANITIYPLLAHVVEGAVIRIDDVTERVRIEEMMIQSEKMLSVGGLAAGMAHEINNPLAVILQSAQVLLSRVRTDSPKNRQVAASCGTTLAAVRAYLEQREIISMIDFIRESGSRADKIVDNMLSYSRKGESHILFHDLAMLLDQTVELAANDYDLKKKYDFRQIRIVRAYHPDTPRVPCEDTKIQQVFLNLLKNGAQAMAEHKKEGRTPCFILRIKPEERLVRVEIEDNGPGMDKATRKRVFEPFFTTKEVGVGTGLGLSVSYFIIHEHHRGTMAVESTPGQGAKFIVRLPLERKQE